jgi:hypothetical protein
VTAISYQMMEGSRLRVLAAETAASAGFTISCAISRSDARDGVYGRFAVARRAHMTLRWH